MGGCWQLTRRRRCTVSLPSGVCTVMGQHLPTLLLLLLLLLLCLLLLLVLLLVLWLLRLWLFLWSL